jgi:hypothetical protein
MIVYPVKDNFMQRDMDLIREILLRVAANQEMDGRTEFIYQSPEEIGITGHSLEEVAYHVKMLIKSGYLEGNLHTGYTMPSISSLTLAGHDFLGNISDPGIWEKLKNQFGALPNVALHVIGEVGLSEIKRKLGLS